MMNGSRRFTFKMNHVGLVSLVFCWCIWTTTCYTNQVDDDLVYKKIEKGSPLLSSQNTDHREQDKVEVGQTASSTVSDDVVPQDRFFERLHEHWHRFKRSWAKDWGVLPSAWPSTENNVEKRDSVKRGDDIESNDSGRPDDEEEDEEDEEDDQNSNTTTLNGSYSGDGSLNTETMTGEKHLHESHKETNSVDGDASPTGTTERNYYRVFIILSTPFDATFNDRTSAKYIEFSNNISAAVKKALAGPSFVNATVVGITKTKDTKESKVLVDLEMTESEMDEKIRDLLSKLDAVPSVPERLAVLDLSDRPTITCAANELSCDKGTYCYPIEGRCNNFTQCSDRSDELDCPDRDDSAVPELEDKCRSDNKYFCPLGVNIICIDDRCDGKKDCHFGEDESPELCQTTLAPPPPPPDPTTAEVTTTTSATTTTTAAAVTTTENQLVCRQDQFSCYNGACMDASKRCDRILDCAEGEDEEGCCTDGFQCAADRLCIDSSKKCDGQRDCADGSDEQECIRSCLADEFRCGDGHCVPEKRRCDGFSDCRDLSDELNCTRACLPDEFRCGDGHCIPSARRCDGLPDCRDLSDEQNCRRACLPDEFRCEDGHCVPEVRRCDGSADCRDLSDEKNCHRACLPDEFRCEDGHCVPEVRRCDGSADCRDLSDEKNCTRACLPEEFQCADRHCILRIRHCDGRPDCRDFSDEIDCPPVVASERRLRAYPNQQVSKEGDDVDFLCRDESNNGIRLNITWERASNLPLPPESKIIIAEGRLHMERIRKNQEGEYICKTISGWPAAQTSVRLFVEEKTTERPFRNFTTCNVNQATCSNGKCIEKFQLCDGKADCADGSDEKHCDKCEPDEFRCENARCIQVTYVCDGEDDCGDGSDELSQNCGEFHCADGTQFIPRGFQCDFNNDCHDGSDEIGCSKCLIVQNTPRNVDLPVGAKFEISCRAVGTPTPLIVFRHNWRHVPPHCKVNSVDGNGTLTCPYVENEDGGAYSCECINNRGRVFGTDTILTVRPENCQPGQYDNGDGCTGCFCFGVTSECQNANLFTSQLQPRSFKVRLVNVLFDSQMNMKVNDLPLQSLVDVSNSSVVTIRGSNDFPTVRPTTGYQYLALPESFLGDQLKSYGGYIKYRVQYEGIGQPIVSPSLILSGNGHVLVYFDSPLRSREERQESVRIVYGSWYKLSKAARAPSSDPFPRVLANRQEIMATLARLDYVLLKAQSASRILNFKFDTAGSTDVGQGKAALLEECRCPDGYTGLSCENCAPGYQRVPGGPWLGQCRRLREPCEPGTYGDPARECLPCPCPMTTPPNRFSPTCFLDTDGQPTCNACPIGYGGRRCEFCTAGFVGNPLVVGGSCQQTACDLAGSQSLTVDAATGRCRCKENVIGANCNQCKPNSFYLSPTNVFGCIKCFCMGVTSECFSSQWYRNQIKASFVRDNQDFKIGDRLQIESVGSRSDNVNVDAARRELIASDLQSSGAEAYYWSLPQRFLGNKVTSYGGVLNYTVRYVPTLDGQLTKNNAPDVEIISEKNSIHLYYYERDTVVEPNVPQTLSIRFLEQYWQRTDGRITNREHLLMALADLKTILIKATYTSGTQLATLSNVVLETAEDRNTGHRRASEVENCRCPAGYRGTSCEDCDTGYRRIDQGLYLGLCEPCNCHGHSRECETDTGKCVNCGDHTTGDNCEQCLPGFEGNPSTGEACRAVRGDCVCDPRGSLSAECRNGECVCKGNVLGPTCGACRRGTFDLQSAHENGCLECYCSGAATECQSSNLFVTQIPMPILDDNHGFTLTTSDRSSKVAKNGFQLNVAQNQIGYDYTTERGSQLFWSLPPAFTGNKITSYGGSLTWTQSFTAPSDAIPTYDNDIVLYGDGIKIVWNNNSPIAANTNVTISVKLHEEGFHRLTASGTSKATRTDMMRILSSLEAVLIRATYASQTSFVSISDVSLDTAVAQPVSNVKATQVELCRCPPGYKGYSCESCTAGYYQLATPYGKECRKCPCNDQEESCFANADGSVTCNCRIGFIGSYCEVPGANSTLAPGPAVPSPTIVVKISEPLIQIVSIGSTVRYRCTAESVYKMPIQVKWSREGAPLPPGRAYNDGQGHFFIINAVQEDSGTYVCEASDGQTFIREKVTVQVEDSSAPRIIVTPEVANNVFEFNTGDAVEINCEATGIPPPTLEWLKESDPNRKLHVGIRSAPLRILAVAKSDEGMYSCRARNNVGLSFKRISIVVRDGFPPNRPDEREVRVSVWPSEVNGLVGETVRLDCTSTPPNNHILRWARADNAPLPRTAEERAGVLTIRNADSGTSGLYVCNAVSVLTNDIVSYAFVTVTIGETAGQNLLAPTLSIDPERQTVAQGSLAVIRCTSPTDPRAAVKWSKVGDKFTSHVEIFNNEIRIPSAVREDRGVYICEYTNAVGEARVSSVLEIDRREPPVVQIYPEPKQKIETGGSTFIQCRVLKGIPRPKIRWLRRGQQAFSSHVIEVEGVLRFTSVTDEDDGEYTCSAENAAGSVDAIAVLEIISRPVVTVSPASPVRAAVGQPIRLECTAAGKPAPIVSWHNGYTEDQRTPTPGTAIFEITRAQLSDTGTYTCSAMNIAGRSEEQVQVIVDEQRPDEVRPSSIIPSLAPVEENVFPLHTDAYIRCSYDSSNAVQESIFYKWEREDGRGFSSRVEERTNTLLIRQVEREDSGRYRCVGIDSSTGDELFSKTFGLRIIAPPNVTLYPTHQVVRPGDNAQITCSATGDEPITIYWSTSTNEPLPRSALIDKGVLRFRGITYSDAGKYVCHARNYVGDAESSAEVRVNQVVRPSTPVILAEDHYKTAIENSDMDLKCTVSNAATLDYQITWSRDRSELPRTSRVVGNTLHLYRLKAGDSDRYMCHLRSPYGVSMDYIDLLVERACLANEFRCSDGTCIPESQYCDTVQHCADNTDEIDCHKHTRGVDNETTIEIESSLKDAKVGDTLHLTCKAKGDASARIVWTKADGDFESNVETRGEVLRITDMQIANVGAYRCSAHTKDGFKIMDYNLNIEIPPTFGGGDIYTVANVTKKSVKYGHSVDLVCDTDLDPPVNYSWVVHSHEKSLRKIVPNTKTLTVTDASANNSGIYFCKAVSSRATFSLPTVLTVENVIPAFAGDSYLTLPPMVHTTDRSDIEINFKPKSYNGLILFNGQRKDAARDFISFGLNGGVPEFRYDVGSGAAIIRGDAPLTMNKWHKVVLSRDRRNGFMEINGMANFTGWSPGKSETLDLQLPLFVGGHLDYAYISKLTELNTGFKGCINRLRIDSKEINLKKEPQSVENVESCNNCDQNPCVNHGFCQETTSSLGYICICRPGYSGENCQLRKDTCYLDSCGAGQCLENEDGIECLCPLGKTGKRCEKRIDINVPAFTKNSYLAYEPLISKKKFKLMLKLKPVGEPEVDNGIILYVAENDNENDDFIALSIVNSYVELRFKVMGRPVNVTSSHYLVPNEYVTVSLTMDSSEVVFSVADEPPVALMFNPSGHSNDLRLHTSLYVGGYDKKSIMLPEEMSVRNGFHGCISTIELLGMDVGILQSYVEAINVNDCFSSFGDICETTLPCKNGGKCLTSRRTYRCECQPNFGGTNCERQKDMCEILNPCRNNGQCVGFTGSFKCYCGLGFSGGHCEFNTTLEDTVSFGGDGYVELQYDEPDEIIHVSFTTKHSNGLFYWHGQQSSISGIKYDFISIAVQNGFVRLAYKADGSGVRSIGATDRRVDDGETHSITVRRVKTQISIELDSKTIDFGEIPETLTTRGNIYIGGLPDVRFTTGNLYADNFNGCIQQLRINNPVVNFGQMAVSARNAASCPNSVDGNEV